jgi:hypothetical protein
MTVPPPPVNKANLAREALRDLATEEIHSFNYANARNILTFLEGSGNSTMERLFELMHGEAKQ